jgi:hypothetical protein
MMMIGALYKDLHMFQRAYIVAQLPKHVFIRAKKL